MLIPPRLNRMLCLLLKSGSAVTVSSLAERLGISTRTVFREMENVDSLLEPYGLRIGTRAGEGIRIEGGSDSRQALLDELQSMIGNEPSDKRERRERLISELLRQSEVQKLFYFANLFRVSEATISGDLDAVTPWLEAMGLTLARRQGLGVCVQGAEKDFRRALVRLLCGIPRGQEQTAWAALFDAKLLRSAASVLRGAGEPLLERMADSSLRWLVISLAVSAERIRSGCAFAEGDLFSAEDAESSALANRLADAAEQAFSTVFSRAETEYLALQISGARMNYYEAEPDDGLLLGQYELQRIAFRMIDFFDSSLAYELKMDDALVRGLALHLKPAIVRLRNGMELVDPLLDQVSRSYPDVYEKSRRAARVLEEEYRCHVPDSEAGFLSMHFGAAVMRLRDRQTRKKTVRIGVICLNGIGVSYMMASQIKAQFRGDVDVEICIHEDLGDLSRFDFLVSSFPFHPAEVSVIEAHPILTGEDVEAIRAEIARRAYVREREPAPPSSRPLAEQARRLELVLQDVQVLLNQFEILETPENSSFEELSKFAGYRFGNSPENGKRLFDDLMARERVSTQVIPSYGFVLLHVRTGGVDRPYFSLIRPEEGNRFVNPYLKAAQTVVVMLVPLNGHPDRGRMMGAISSKLVEDEEFLRVIREGGRAQVLAELESLFRGFLAEIIKQITEG